MPDPVRIPSFTRDHLFLSRVIENRLLSGPGSAKEIRHVAVSLAGSGLSYTAGDSLGVLPTNPPGEVEAILKAMGADGREPVTLPRLPAAIPLKEALATRLALSGPTRVFTSTLAAKVEVPDSREFLNALLLPEAAKTLQAWLDERGFIDLLEEFPSARISPQELVNHMRRLVPRLYSISSSPRVNAEVAELTVAVVRYTSNRRERVGVCSTFLGERVVVGETPVPVFVSSSHFGPPEDGSRDAIMVGPGTGIAPFRAFLQDRAIAGAGGRNWVFFGDQRRATDFIYEADFTAWQKSGVLTRLDTAFSRDQPRKIYVQDGMRENAPELWSWIKAGSFFYVCGDAKRMARDVDAALHEILSTQGGMTPVQAVDYVKLMKREKRYQRDVY